jgi:Acetyltransferase (GNAT) domain
MNPSVELLDGRSVSRLPERPGTPEDLARRYVASVVAAGPQHYVDNAKAEMKALVVDGTVLPVTINREEEENAAVCSPFAHYVRYTLEAVAKRHPQVPPRLFGALMLPLAVLLKRGRIDRVVSVNNWLFSTNPGPRLSKPQIAAATARLIRAYPDSAIAFRSLNPVTDRPVMEGLRANGYRFVRSRRVYIVDAAHRRHLDHKDVRNDLRLLKRTPYEIVRDHGRLQAHVDRLTALYRDLYLTKHSRLNPGFNEHFIALTLRERILSYLGFERNGSVDGFIAYFVRDGVMTGVLVGYDQRLPRKLGLYRLVFGQQMADAAAQGLQLNLSAGADQFKVLRGGIPVEEFDAVHSRHLPAGQRLAWAALEITTRLWTRIGGGRRRPPPVPWAPA